MKIYNKHNFHKHTFCIFKEVLSEEIEDLKINFMSKSGSSYLFTEQGVYRKSNHWGRAANCKWRLESTFAGGSRTKIGFAKWINFHPINSVEKLYFIEVDFEKKSVQYNHKGLTQDPILYLRTATETMKRVKEIRNLFENDKKLRYWETSIPFDELLQKVINQLINTDFSLLEIKNQIS